MVSCIFVANRKQRRYIAVRDPLVSCCPPGRIRHTYKWLIIFPSHSTFYIFWVTHWGCDLRWAGQPEHYHPSPHVCTLTSWEWKQGLTEYMEFHPSHIGIVDPLKTSQMGLSKNQRRRKGHCWKKKKKKGNYVVSHELSSHRQVSHRGKNPHTCSVELAKSAHRWISFWRKSCPHFSAEGAASIFGIFWSLLRLNLKLRLLGAWEDRARQDIQCTKTYTGLTAWGGCSCNNELFSLLWSVSRTLWLFHPQTLPMIRGTIGSFALLL